MATGEASAAAGRYLTLILNDEPYGIVIEKVREIIHAGKIMPLSQFSRHIRGVVNVRGRIIPVMDLRSRLGLIWQSQEESCIVLVQVHGYGETPVMMGLSVDKVEDVLRFDADQITMPLKFSPGMPVLTVLGAAMRGEKSMILLDIDRVVAPELSPGPRQNF